MIGSIIRYFVLIDAISGKNLSYNACLNCEPVAYLLPQDHFYVMLMERTRDVESG